MIKMTYMSGGSKVELNFDTVEELERFNERRMEKLEAQRMKDEERLEAERAESYSFFAKGFSTSPASTFLNHSAAFLGMPIQDSAVWGCCMSVVA